MINAKEINNPKRNKQTKKSTLRIWLYGKEIILINTKINNAESIVIDADELDVNNVEINSKEVEISSEEIEAYYSYINSDITSITTNIEEESITQKLNINSNTLFINGIEVNQNEKIIYKNTIEIQKQRLKLISKLKNISSLCEEKIREEIKKQPLTRILRKEK